MTLYHSVDANFGQFFDIASAVIAVISAGLWFASARINFTVGYDTDMIFKQELRRAGQLNAWAAACAALVAVGVAAKTFLVAV